MDLAYKTMVPSTPDMSGRKGGILRLVGVVNNAHMLSVCLAVEFWAPLDGRNSAPHSALFPQALAAGWNCALHTGARARWHLITRKIIQNHPHFQVSALLGFDVKPAVAAGGDCSGLRVYLFPWILKTRRKHFFRGSGDTNADNSTSAPTQGGNDGRYNVSGPLSWPDRLPLLKLLRGPPPVATDAQPLSLKPSSPHG